MQDVPIQLSMELSVSQISLQIVKKQLIISKDVNTSAFDINFGGIAYDRPYFNIDDSSADKWYFERLVMTSDDVNGKMAFLVSFCECSQ